MFDNDYLEKYAEVLLWALSEARPLPLRNADMVVVRFDAPALPLVDALYRLLIERHLNPVPVMRDTDAMRRELYENSSFGQLIFQRPGESALYESAAGVITILAPQAMENPAVDLKTVAAHQAAAKPLMYRIERKRRMGEQASTICVYPTEELARVAGVEPGEYADNVARACRLTTPEPVKEWRSIKKNLNEVASWLNGLKAVGFTVESEGMRLSVEPGEMRRFVGFTGLNVPACEIYVSPDRRGVSGTFYADMPTIRHGRLAADVRLTFQAGLLVNVEAKRGLPLIRDQIAAAEGAGAVGEFSLTDVRFSHVNDFMAHTLLDENFAGEHGNCHIALGDCCPECYAGPTYELDAERRMDLGFNTSTIHWDLVSTRDRQVTAHLPGGGRKVVYEKGRFAC